MGKKVKISNTKRSQHLKNKKNYAKPLKRKQLATPTSKSSEKSSLNSKKVFGRLSLDKPRPKKKQRIVKQLPLPATQNGSQGVDENDEDNMDDILDMMDDEDKAIIEGYRTAQKRKRDENEDENTISANKLEKQYATEKNAESFNKKRTVNLLPIKTKLGEIITRTTEVDIEDEVEPEDNLESEEEENVEELDSDDDIINDKTNGTNLAEASKNAVSTADLLMLREEELNRQKYRIGIICSGILEKPEDKMKNFKALFDLMGEKNNDDFNLFSVRKISMLSILEVFKDIIPEYRIGQINLKTQTVKKTTMERVTFEDALLMYYKKFLQRLEKMTSNLSKGGGSKRRLPQEFIKLGEVATTCLCELLLAHPYFNFSQNIAQLLVYLLNSNFTNIRTAILECFRTTFQQDSKFDLTLFIVRRLNHLIKSKSNFVHVEVISCLLALQIKSINLDVEKEKELKQKKLEAHKARLINMSKKEKKRMKRLSQLDKELQETKAEENKQTKHYKLTEVTKMVFTIYFRILKNDPSSQLLSAILEGLAEFAHIINLDFFADLVEVLNNLMENGDLGYREQLHCIQTVFTILSGQGEVLNIDPLRFYGHLYRNLLVCNAGKNHSDLLIIIRTLVEVLVKRRKSITHHRLLAFIKRIVTLSLQVLHNGSLACLSIVKNVMQLTSALEMILDTDGSIGSGRYNPELSDPEYCNANCTALYELALLARHYHPIVKKLAIHIAAGVPASGDGSLPPEYGKLSSLEFLEQYDSSEMAFKPAIPAPRPIDLTKGIKGRHFYVNEDLEETVKCALRQPITHEKVSLNFYAEFKKQRKSK